MTNTIQTWTRIGIGTACGLLALKNLYTAAHTAMTIYEHCVQKESSSWGGLTWKFTTASPDPTCCSQILILAEALLVIGVSGHALYRSFCYFPPTKKSAPLQRSPLLSMYPSDTPKPEPKLSDFDHWPRTS